MHTEILTPDRKGAERNQLWNAAEEAEKRKDSRTAREWVIALPHELDAKQRQALAVQFGKALVVRYGVAVDVAVHMPDKDGDNRNHHAHILTTTRQVSRNHAGELVMGDKSHIELSDTKRRSMGLGDVASEVSSVRELWERLANEALYRAGQDSRIDCRSLKARSFLNKEATVHMGPAATDMERRGIRTDRGDINRSVKASNDERARLGAEIVSLESAREARREKERKEKQERRERYMQKQDDLLSPYHPYAMDMQRRIDGFDSFRQAENLFQSQAGHAINAYVEAMLPQAVEEKLKYAVLYKSHCNWHEQSEQKKLKSVEAMTACDDGLGRWRKFNPVKSWLHDKGWWQSKEITNREREYARLHRNYEYEKSCADRHKQDAEKTLQALHDDARKELRAEAIQLIENPNKLCKAAEKAWEQEHEDEKSKAFNKLFLVNVLGDKVNKAEKTLKSREDELKLEKQRKQQERDERWGRGRSRGSRGR